MSGKISIISPETSSERDESLTAAVGEIAEAFHVSSGQLEALRNPTGTLDPDLAAEMDIALGKAVSREVKTLHLTPGMLKTIGKKD